MSFSNGRKMRKSKERQLRRIFRCVYETWHMLSVSEQRPQPCMWETNIVYRSNNISHFRVRWISVLTCNIWILLFKTTPPSLFNFVVICCCMNWIRCRLYKTHIHVHDQINFDCRLSMTHIELNLACQRFSLAGFFWWQTY